jgi:hypothetical protein
VKIFWAVKKVKKINFLPLLSFLILGTLCSCATKERPTYLLVLASAALKAAEVAEAERRAPDDYRKAENYFWDAKTFYKSKQFEKAELAAQKAVRYAEEAELKAALAAALGTSDEQ